MEVMLPCTLPRNPIVHINTKYVLSLSLNGFNTVYIPSLS